MNLLLIYVFPMDAKEARMLCLWKLLSSSDAARTLSLLCKEVSLRSIAIVMLLSSSSATCLTVAFVIKR